MAIETGLEGKPWYIPATVALVLAAGLVFLVHYFSLKDIKNQIQAQDSRLTDLQKQINEGRSAQRSLPQFREEVQRLELELEKLLRILPSQRVTQDLLRRIRALTEQGDFVLQRFNPGSPSPQDFYSIWPIEIGLDGTYHELALFFDRISRFSRIINVDRLTITALNKSGGPHTLMAAFTATTFLYNDPEELEP